MSEKLTVAELLARAQQEGKTRSDRPRRRRRRSLEEGGISVSELTGSIPVVRDRSAAAHSDGGDKEFVDVAGESGAPAVSEPVSEPGVAEQPAEQPAAEPAEAEASEEETSDEVAEELAPEADAEPEVVESEVAPASEPEPVAEVEPETEPEPEAELEPEAEAVAAPQERLEAESHPRTDSIPFVIPAAPREVDVDDATGDITFSFEAVTAADPEMPPFEAPGEVSVDKLESGETEVFPTVPDMADATDEPVGLTVPAQVDADVDEAADVDEDLDDEDYDAYEDYDEDYNEDLEAEDYDGDFDDEDYDEEDYEGADDDAEDDEDDAISWPVLIGEVIVGLAIGAGIFLGFEKLWESAPVWLVVALAIAVIVLLMAVVQVLRRERDILTMLMAAAAGAAITFGPALLA
ncbi:hypothetical protein [Corynebacterium ulceribovis]|uniref:hypothetical protein n=1 Tax=Corynebacterium ulceribovis TaxID=487732 RepID=UPI000361D1A7|nr:hypothetical protein [Corynebacterium ulceribovis]